MLKAKLSNLEMECDSLPWALKEVHANVAELEIDLCIALEVVL